MKKLCILCAVLLSSLLLASCSLFALAPTSKPSESASVSEPSPSPSESESVSPSPDVSPSEEPSPSPSPSASPSPSESPSPSPSTFGETPDEAGNDDVLFDIYKSKASADLNLDGTPEELEFKAGKTSSTLKINGKSYTIKKAGLAQTFAITDVNKSDKVLEIAFTDPYKSLADSEKAFTWLYWWNGKKLINMGGLMDVKFAGKWRKNFNPTKYFDAKGVVTCLARTQHFSDVWYNAHYKATGTSRVLKEVNYAAKPADKQIALTLKKNCVLLKNVTSKYFGSAYNEIWDAAGSYATLPRNHSDAAIAFIPQAGEKLKIVAVYGPNWFKLQASDGKKGWLKCVDMNIQGYWQVMQYSASQIFDGIVIAG